MIEEHVHAHDPEQEDVEGEDDDAEGDVADAAGAAEPEGDQLPERRRRNEDSAIVPA